MNTFFEEAIPSRWVRMVLCGLGGIILVLVIFAFGVHVGEQKICRSDYPFHDEGSSLSPSGRSQRFFLFPNSHGVFGRITRADEAVIVVHTAQGRDQEVVTTPTTAFRRGSATVSRNDLIPPRDVAVFGRPTTGGRIEAMLIRLLSADQP